MGKGCKVLFTDCDPTQAQDRELPNNSYLIEYLQDGQTTSQQNSTVAVR